MTQATIKYEDGQAYEKGMGVWSQLAGQQNKRAPVVQRGIQ